MESIASLVIPLSRIQPGRFCLRDSLEDAALSCSLREHGLLQPLTVIASGKYFDLISGHKRLAWLKKSKNKTVTVFLLAEKSPKKLFLSALLLNHALSYSDLDRCRVIGKAMDEFFFSAEDIRGSILPLMGLPPSLKILNQYRQTEKLPEIILNRIRRQEIPFQSSFWLANFKKADLDFLANHVLVKIRPTSSQLAHICEWLLDLIQIKRQPAADILKIIPSPAPKKRPGRGQGEGLRPHPNLLPLKKEKGTFRNPPTRLKANPFSVSKTNDLRAATDIFYQNLRDLRFPNLANKEKAFNQAAGELRGKVKGLEIRAPDHFEQEGFSIRAQLQNPKHLSDVILQLQKVQNQAAALFDTIL